MQQDDRVLIVGAGPVGAITGLSLAQQGISVSLFDLAPAPPDDHRAATLQPSTLDLFAEFGLTEELLRRGIKSRYFQWRDRVTMQVVAEFDYGLLSTVSAHPYVIQIEQHKTVDVILKAAQRFADFDLHRPVNVVAVRQDADHVEIDIDHDGEIETRRGRYLIGCDGGRSIVRKTSGASFEGFTWPERFNIVATRNDFAATHGFRFRNYCAHPERWVSLMKVPGEDDQGVWRCVFPAKTAESDEEVMSDAWIQARFAECFPDWKPHEIIHRNMYSVHQRVAGSFREGRIALAGDAAHVNNPIGGMGMNSGFQDGLNLAKKIGAIWRGAEPDPLLDRYDRQRRLTAIEYVQAQSIANKKTLEERDEARRKAALDDLRRKADNPAEHFDYVRRGSLIAMWEKSEAIE